MFCHAVYQVMFLQVDMSFLWFESGDVVVVYRRFLFKAMVVLASDATVPPFSGPLVVDLSRVMVWRVSSFFVCSLFVYCSTRFASRAGSGCHSLFPWQESRLVAVLCC